MPIVCLAHFESVQFPDVSDPAALDGPVVSGADVHLNLLVRPHSILHGSGLQGEGGEVPPGRIIGRATLARTRDSMPPSQLRPEFRYKTAGYVSFQSYVAKGFAPFCPFETKLAGMKRIGVVA